MLKVLLATGALFLSQNAFAETLHCRADEDESSHYEVDAVIADGTITGPIHFRYLTEDGIDLTTDLVPKESSVVRGAGFQFSADGESMGLMGVGTYHEDIDGYETEFTVSFGLEHADPVIADGVCTIH